MSKHKYKTNQKTVCVKRAINTDVYTEKFYLDNAFMRNQIRNDFAEEANKYKGKWNKYNDFNPREFHTYYFNNVEEPEKRYHYYCVGLSDQVTNDFIASRKTIRTKNRKKLDDAKKNGIPFDEVKLDEFHFKRFDFNRYSFKVTLSFPVIIYVE